MNDKRYPVNSRIFAGAKRGRRTVQIIFAALSVVFMVYTVYGYYSRGINAVEIGILTVLILAALKPPALKFKYIDVTAVVSFKDKGMTVEYSAYDREDGNGIRVKGVELAKGMINTVEYGEKLKCIRFTGQINVEDLYQNGQRSRMVLSEYMLYVADVPAKAIIKDIETCLNRKVSIR